MTAGHVVQIGALKYARELFEKGYPAGQSPCTCASKCCQWGVYVDVREKERILEHRRAIADQMDETQTRNEKEWFENDEHDDPDFPSGRCVGTHVHHDKCVFLDKVGRCAIQLAAVAAGLDRWAWKPMYCVLFPIEISDGIVSFDPMLQGDESCCSIRSGYDTPLFRACSAELIHLIGQEGYDKLEEFYRGLEKEVGSGNIAV
ncbi:MAG: DUF3109 family protein [Bacteroidetes bacterium]|nr:DUF3109 family protein [Bacteroidota bacterium]